jgi:hypothetical protein
MSSETCGFCGHGNPAGAKYCNECAFPAHLWRCKQCDTVNERSAPSCPRCGAAQVVEEVEDDPLESLTFDSELDFGPSTLGGGDPARAQGASADSSRIQIADLRRGSSAATEVVEILAHKSATGAWVTPSFFPPQHAAPTVALRATDTKVRRRRAIPIAITTVLITAGAVGLYLSGTGPGGDGTPTGRNSHANGDATQVAVPAVDRTGTGAAVLATVPSASAPSSVIEGRIRMLDKPGPEKENSAVASLASPSSPDATTAPSPLTRTDGNAVKRSNGSKTKAVESVASSQPRRSMAASSSARASAFPDAETLVVRPAVGARDDGAALDRERQRPCTDRVAALGLCSSNAQARSP